MQCSVIISGDNEYHFLAISSPFHHHFFYDILIFKRTFTEHLTYLGKDFQILLDGQFFLKLLKCSFAQKQVGYLGHMVSTQGVEPIPTKVQAIQ